MDIMEAVLVVHLMCYFWPFSRMWICLRHPPVEVGVCRSEEHDGIAGYRAGGQHACY